MINDPTNFIRSARDFYSAGREHFSPGYEQYGDLLAAAEAIAATPPTSECSETAVQPQFGSDVSGVSTISSAAVTTGQTQVSAEPMVSREAAAKRLDDLAKAWGAHERAGAYTMCAAAIRKMPAATPTQDRTDG